MESKVYVVVISQVSDYADLGTQVKVFGNYGKAKDYLKEWRDDEVRYFQGDEYIIDYDLEDCFSACLKDGWAETHSEAWIEEQEVN